MAFEQLHVPAPYKYLSDAIEAGVLPGFDGDLPDNIYLDKTSTGCGATTAVLTNDVPYVVVVPFISLGDNKVLQSEQDPSTYPHKLLMVHGETDNVDIHLYLKNPGVHKILVTYDSLPRLLSYLDPTQYKLFVDECHKLIEYAGNFKPQVVQAIMDLKDRFKSYVFCTATPTKEKYLPEKLKDVRKIKITWEVSTWVHIDHVRLHPNQIHEAVLSLALSYLRGERDGNAYFFYNSVSNISKILKDLAVYGFTSDHVKVICADTPRNVKSLRSAGRGYRPRKPVELASDGSLLLDHKRLTFVTSTAFEGQDFLDPEGRTYILSDGRLEHTKLDIATQVSQIIGRLRVSKYKDTITLLWSVSPTLGYSTLEEYEKYVQEQKESYEGVVEEFQGLKQELTKSLLVAGANKKNTPFLIDMTENGVPDLIVNPDASNHLLNMFEGTALQWCVNSDDPSKARPRKAVTTTLREVFAGTVVSSYEAPKLRVEDKRKLGRKGNYSEMALIYAKALDVVQRSAFFPVPEAELRRAEEIKDEVETSSRYDTLVEYIDMFGLDEDFFDSSTAARAEKFLANKIQKAKEKERLSVFLKHTFNAGEVYTLTDLKERLQSIYRRQDISGTPKTGDLDLVFNTKRTSVLVEGKKEHAIKLVSPK